MAEEDKKKRGPLDKAAEVPDVVDVFTPAVTETKKGGLKIDRSKVTPVFDYGQVFTEDNIKTIEEQFGSKINQLDQFNIKDSKELVKVMNGVVSPQRIYFENPNLPPIEVSQFTDAWNRSRIDDLRKKEMMGEDVSILEQVGILKEQEREKPKEAKYFIGGNTQATRAKMFLDYLDKTDINPLDKVKLINRQVLGTGQDAEKLFERLGLKDQYTKFTNIAEKGALRFAELPRTVLDALGTMYGYVGEYGFAGGRKLAEGLNIVPEDYIPKFDEAGQVISRGFFQDFFLINSDARDAYRRAIGPDAVENYQRLLAQDGIILTKGQARDVMNFNFTSTGRFLEHAPTLVAEVMTVLGFARRGAKKVYEEVKKHESLNPGMTKPEVLNSFVAKKVKPGSFFSKMREKIISKRIKRGQEISEAEKPLEQRVLFQEAKKAKELAEDDYLNALQSKLGKDQTIFDEASIAKEFADVKAKRLFYEQKKYELFAIQNAGNTPKWVAESYRETGMFAGFVGLSGQYLQNLGFNQDFSYLAGATGAIGYGLISGALTGGRAIDQYLDIVNPDSSSVFYKYLDNVEQLGFDSTEEIVAFLRNPVLDNLSPKSRKMANKLSTTLNGVDEQFRPQLVANIEYYFDFKKRLKDKGIDSNLITEGLGSITGIGIFTAIEDSFISSVDYSDLLNKKTMPTFIKLQEKKEKLHANLTKVYEEIFKSGKYDINDPELSQIRVNVENVLKDLQERNQSNMTLMEGFVAFKKSMLDNMLDGGEIPNVKFLKGGPKELSDIHDSLLDDAELLLQKKLQQANVAPLSIGQDIKSYTQYVADIENMQRDIETHMFKSLSVYDSTIDSSLANIVPVTKETIKTTKKDGELEPVLKGKKAQVKKETVNVQKYVNEDATLARMVLTAKNNAQTNARIPMIEFDAKYKNLRIDATDFVFSFIDESRMVTRGTKQLVGQALPRYVDYKIVNIINKRAAEVMDRYEIDPKNVIESMRKEGYDTANITNIDMLKFLREGTDEIPPLNIGIGFSMADTTRLYDFFNARAAKSTDNVIPFARYRDKAEGLFNNVVSTNGVKLQQTSDIFKELNRLKKLYFAKKIGVFDTKGKTSYNWANPRRSADQDNVENPGGMEWSKENHPRTWISVQKVLEGKNIQDINNTLIETFGDVTVSGNIVNREIGKNNIYRANLQLIANIKYKKAIRDLQNQELSATEFTRKRIELENNLTNAFKVRKLEFGSDNVESLFDARAVQEDTFELSRRAKENKDIQLKVAEIQESVAIEATQQKNVINQELLKQRNRVNELIQGQNFNTPKEFFERFFLKDDGYEKLNEYKKEVVNAKLMTEEQFNKAARSIFSRYVKGTFLKPTGRFKPLLNKGGAKPDIVKEVDTDFQQLNDFLNNDELKKNMIKSGYFTEDHIKTLELVNEVLARQKKIDVDRAKFTGQPTGLSIESYISRFYAINRNVVSPKYVGTEALIQNLRMTNHRLLEEMFTDQKVAEAVADLIMRGDKLSDARVIQIDSILKVIAVRAAVEYRETAQEDIAREQMRFEIPKQRRSMKEQMDELSNIDRYKSPKFVPQAPFR